MSSFSKKIGSFQVSHEHTQLQVNKAKTYVKSKIINGQEVKTTIFKEVNKASTDTLTARLTSSELGQQLSFGFMRGGSEEDAKDPLSRILATFTMTKDFQLSMVCNHEFNAINSYIFKPLITAFPGIEAESMSDVFSQWLCTEEFFEHLKIVSSKKGYTPALVKMLVLFISYQDVKDEVGTQLGQFTNEIVVDIQEVARVFRENMLELQSDVPKMAKHYSSDLLLAPSQGENTKADRSENNPEQLEPITSDSTAEPIAEEVDPPEPEIVTTPINPDNSVDEEESVMVVTSETEEVQPE